MKAVCTAIRTEGAEQGVRIINDTHVSISILGHVNIENYKNPQMTFFVTESTQQKNNTDMGRFTIFRGIKNIRDLGRIIKVNNDR
jgi:hypothetical protein